MFVTKHGKAWFGCSESMARKANKQLRAHAPGTGLRPGLPRRSMNRRRRLVAAAAVAAILWQLCSELWGLGVVAHSSCGLGAAGVLRRAGYESWVTLGVPLVIMAGMQLAWAKLLRDWHRGSRFATRLDGAKVVTCFCTRPGDPLADFAFCDLIFHRAGADLRRSRF